MQLAVADVKCRRMAETVTGLREQVRITTSTFPQQNLNVPSTEPQGSLNGTSRFPEWDLNVP
jgi:hypothetical protein